MKHLKNLGRLIYTAVYKLKMNFVVVVVVLQTLMIFIARIDLLHCLRLTYSMPFLSFIERE